MASQPTRAETPAASSLESQRLRSPAIQSQSLPGDPLLYQLAESATHSWGAAVKVGAGDGWAEPLGRGSEPEAR